MILRENDQWVVRLVEFAGTQGIGISPVARATDILLAPLTSSKDDVRLEPKGYLKQNPTEGIIKQIYNAKYADDPGLRKAAYMTQWEIGATGYKLPLPAQFGFS